VLFKKKVSQLSKNKIVGQTLVVGLAPPTEEGEVIEDPIDLVEPEELPPQAMAAATTPTSTPSSEATL